MDERYYKIWESYLNAAGTGAMTEEEWYSLERNKFTETEVKQDVEKVMEAIKGVV
jgi:hypothetical protein